MTLLRHLRSGTDQFFHGDLAEVQTVSRQEFFKDFESDFIPLSDKDLLSQVAEYATPQPKEVPGDPEGKIPGIEAFHSPSKAQASIFTKIYFHTDQHIPNAKEYLHTLSRISQYLKKHPHTYIFIEGYCDERASEAYNLALGTKRANYVRNFLIKSGVNPSQLFTISYGKEKPEALGHNPKSWAKNRRVCFKIYEKSVSL
jgi:peptidoglycan-associated lipoprotein